MTPWLICLAILLAGTGVAWYIVQFYRAQVRGLQTTLRVEEQRRQRDELNHQRAIADARRSSVTQSRAGINAAVAENFTPVLPGFPYDLSDARHFGDLFDFIVYDGLHEGGEIREVVFMEVKTGGARLSERQRKLRDAVQAGRVRWMVWRPDRAMTAEALEAS